MFLNTEAIVHQRFLSLICGFPVIVVQWSVYLSRTNATQNVDITCTTLKFQTAEKITFIFTVGRRNGLTEMRKREMEKERICEEEGTRVVS